MPDPKSAEGKALTKIALELEPDAWLGQLRTDTSARLTHAVTLGRRAGTTQRWKKARHSVSNKICNAILGDIRTADKLQKELDSLPVAE
jgi:hypothetical protein